MSQPTGNFGHKDWCSLPNCLGSCDCHPEQPDLLGALQDSIERTRAQTTRPRPPQPGDPARRCRCAEIRRPHYRGDHPPETPEET